jgi:hypothetical protein
VSVGLLFLWLGALKLLPNVSHAEDLAVRVMSELTTGLVPADASRPLLAALEMLIGAGLLTRLTLEVFFGLRRRAAGAAGRGAVAGPEAAAGLRVDSATDRPRGQGTTVRGDPVEAAAAMGAVLAVAQP